MINILLHDQYKNELQIGDVIIINYPNAKVKFLGELVFDDKDARFVISDGTEFKPVNESWNAGIEKLGPAEKNQKIKKQYGYIQNCTADQLTYLYSLICN